MPDGKARGCEVILTGFFFSIGFCAGVLAFWAIGCLLRVIWESIGGVR